MTPDYYSPDLLRTVARADIRRALGLGDELPFHGEDLWTAYEMTWLDRRGKPVVAIGTIRVPAESDNLIESKSLKLYLNSFSMTRSAAASEVAATVARDLSKIAGAAIDVTLTPAGESVAGIIAAMPGDCIDSLDVACDFREVDPSLLQRANDRIVTEELHSHLLRSNCPVTNQPDLGSILIRYSGPELDRSALLRYLVSYRRHKDFHESCVERIFVDLKNRCSPDRLTVYARFNRRGGLDINPFRSDYERKACNLRLWRQ